MSISLAELLPLVAASTTRQDLIRARERLRRFLLDTPPIFPTIQTLARSSAVPSAKQHHRVLQDLIVVVGRVLRFAISLVSTSDRRRHQCARAMEVRRPA